MLSAIDDILDELRALRRQRASSGQALNLQDIKVVVELLERLSVMELHRCSCRQSMGPSSNQRTGDVPVAQRAYPNDPNPRVLGEERQCESCARMVWISHHSFLSRKIEDVN